MEALISLPFVGLFHFSLAGRADKKEKLFCRSNLRWLENQKEIKTPFAFPSMDVNENV